MRSGADVQGGHVQLREVYARFYRSLNYDFIKASDQRYEPAPWDETHEGDYPFVRITLKPDITTIVGANESGKSQVLRAIQGALTGTGYDRSDFCRYSKFFGTDDRLVEPEFGAVYSDISTEDVSTIQGMTSLKNLTDVQRVAVFRVNESPRHRMYVREGKKWTEGVNIRTPTSLAKLGVPEPFYINADTPLPDRVPLSYLATGKASTSAGREGLHSMWEVVAKHPQWFATKDTVSSHAESISAAFRGAQEVSEEDLAKYRLADDLLIKITGLGRELYKELETAVRTKNGYANSLVDTVNAELAKALDFPQWWSQDSRFELFVSLFEFDLAFMIRDRTGRTYDFSERSDGMKYFLSYFVQYLSHEARHDGRPELLLMDEPDKFLSSSGQQDLLKIFGDFAHPRDQDRRPVQVVYVTHSPFLIDKNHADRIRVLDKGEYDEGTRVIKSTAANHYEPLRSAFGSFVAETTFIGNCNLILEGASDQVLLAGVARWLKGRAVADRDNIDLNSITLVPAGGTRHIPYLVYLARGRDIEKPPVVVLLDNDKAGHQAREDLAEGGAYGDRLLDATLVLQLGHGDLAGLITENPGGICGIEDVIPLGIALAAVKVYCEEFVPKVTVGDLELTVDVVYGQAAVADAGKTPRNRGLMTYLEMAIRTATGLAEFHLDKVAFARAVVDVISAPTSRSAVTDDDLQTMAGNMRLLLAAITNRQRQAIRAESVDKISSRVNRAKREFVRTHKGSARREHVAALIEEISSQLDNSPEAEGVRATMREWQRTFSLDQEPRELVANYAALLKSIDQLAYQATRAAEA